MSFLVTMVAPGVTANRIDLVNPEQVGDDGIKNSGATRRDFFRQSAVAAAIAPAVLGLGGKAFGQVGKSDQSLFIGGKR